MVVLIPTIMPHEPIVRRMGADERTPLSLLGFLIEEADGRLVGAFEPDGSYTLSLVRPLALKVAVLLPDMHRALVSYVTDIHPEIGAREVSHDDVHRGKTD